jgi:hypothetical protein
VLERSHGMLMGVSSSCPGSDAAVLHRALKHSHDMVMGDKPPTSWTCKATWPRR